MRFREQPLAVFGERDVDGGRRRLATAFAYVGDRLFERAFQGMVALSQRPRRRDDLAALRREQPRNLRPNPPAGAGDDASFAV